MPVGALDFWKARLAAFDIAFSESARFSENYIEFLDHDGLQLEIVEREDGALNTWSFGGIPTDKAIKGFGGAVLYSAASTMFRLAANKGELKGSAIDAST